MLYLELKLTGQREGRWRQRPGSIPGQVYTNQWGSLLVHSHQGASGKAQKAPLFTRGASCAGPLTQRVKGRDTPHPLEQSWTQEEHRKIWTRR